jgi:hypothetical protein
MPEVTGLMWQIVYCATSCPAVTISTGWYWYGCHNHAVPATWLGHPRLMHGRDG